MKRYIILIGFLISGCASQSQLAINEYAWTEHTCSGIKSWDDCKQAALNACPEAFYIRNEFENITNSSIE